MNPEDEQLVAAISQRLGRSMRARDARESELIDRISTASSRTFSSTMSPVMVNAHIVSLRDVDVVTSPTRMSPGAARLFTSPVSPDVGSAAGAMDSPGFLPPPPQPVFQQASDHEHDGDGDVGHGKDHDDVEDDDDLSRDVLYPVSATMHDASSPAASSSPNTNAHLAGRSRRRRPLFHEDDDFDMNVSQASMWTAKPSDNHDAIPSRRVSHEQVVALSAALDSSNKNLQHVHEMLRSALDNERVLRREIAELTQAHARVRDQDRVEAMTRQHMLEAQMREHVSRADMLQAENTRLLSLRSVADADVTRQLKDMQASLDLARRIHADEKHGMHRRLRDVAQHCARLRDELQQLRGHVGQVVLAEAQTLANQIAPVMQHAASGVTASSRVEELEAQLESMRRKYQREHKRRQALHNQLQELRGNIRVCVRVRPVLTRVDGADAAAATASKPGLTVVDEETVMARGRSFELDRIFDPRTSQDDVFADVAPLMTSLLDGYNVCIMAYGQTGSGKTYTMQGSEQHPGIIPRCIAELDRLINERSEGSTIALSMSVYEIYNNEIRDLLVAPKVAASRRYDVRAGVVTSLEQIHVEQVHELERYIDIGQRHRAEGATKVNAHSSRSHLIVSVTVTSTHHETNIVSSAMLSLVDLAGSECVGQSGAVGTTLRETRAINRSLCALGDVLGALNQSNAYVPYRNSRLTQALQHQLGGDSKMLLFVTVNPTTQFLSESLHSLAFGMRARVTSRRTAQRHLQQHCDGA